MWSIIFMFYEFDCVKNKIQVFDKNLHEIKNEILQDYVGEFETVGNLKVGDEIRQTHFRFRNAAD